MSFLLFLRQDEEFLEEGDALEMEVREPETRVELESGCLYPIHPFQTFVKEKAKKADTVKNISLAGELGWAVGWGL